MAARHEERTSAVSSQAWYSTVTKQKPTITQGWHAVHWHRHHDLRLRSFSVGVLRGTKAGIAQVVLEFSPHTHSWAVKLTAQEGVGEEKVAPSGSGGPCRRRPALQGGARGRTCDWGPACRLPVRCRPPPSSPTGSGSKTGRGHTRAWRTRGHCGCLPGLSQLAALRAAGSAG